MASEQNRTIVYNEKYRPFNAELKKYALFIHQISAKALMNSQLPNPIPGTKLWKPPKW